MLNYSDVYLVPKYSVLKSRSEADISTEFLGRRFNSPVIPANMESVLNVPLAKWLSENNYFYIMHRFGDNMEFVKTANAEKWNLISISVGVKQEDKEFLSQIVKQNLRVDYITIDIAHGHSILMKEMIEYILWLWVGFQPNIIAPSIAHPLPKIIAGNVATRQAVADLASWGADAVKVGIAGGGACSTKNMTGFHVPMFSCVENCAASIGIAPIIADGGVRENGDIAKALAAGADMVMVGGLLAACCNAPGENIYGEKEPLSDGHIGFQQKIVGKKYHGSASARQKGERKHVEGFEIEIKCNGLTYEEKYKEINESLQSSVSYAGGKNLSDLRKVKWNSIK